MMKASYKRKKIKIKITNNIYCLAVEVGLHEVLDDLPPGATLGERLTLVTNIQGFELKSIYSS
jgi:hypothetical protein